MKVCIAGSRELVDYSDVEEAVKQSGFTITEVVSGGARGGDSLGEDYAKNHSLPIKKFEPDWGDISSPDAKVKVNKYGKKYNVLAGFQRNEQMAQYADVLIALQTTGKTPGTQDCIRRFRLIGKEVFVYEGQK